MNARVIIRTAAREDLKDISRLRKRSILETIQCAYSTHQLQQWSAAQVGERALERIMDGCVLVGHAGGRMVATNGLDLDGEEMVGLFVDPAFQRNGLGRRMVQSVERLAIQFGMTRLRTEVAVPSIGFYRACKYHRRPGAEVGKDPRTGLVCLSMTRAFPRRQTRYGARIWRVLQKTGIPRDYGRIHRLKLQPECRELATIGMDIHRREQMLHPEAAMAWYDLRDSARVDGIELRVVSAFRSVGYQVSIIERKRQDGQEIDSILRVSAAPGYSEHHSGYALDLTCPDSTPLEECFENTPAFEWLTENAGRLGWRMSFPRNNRHRIAYEPWHWRFHP